MHAQGLLNVHRVYIKIDWLILQVSQTIEYVIPVLGVLHLMKYIVDAFYHISLICQLFRCTSFCLTFHKWNTHGVITCG